MQFLPTGIALWIVAAAATQIVSPNTRLTRSSPVLVRSVLDGDTIDVAAFGRVRLLGIDAPEIGRGFDTAAPFALEARDRLGSAVLNIWDRLEAGGASLYMCITRPAQQ